MAIPLDDEYICTPRCSIRVQGSAIAIGVVRDSASKISIDGRLSHTRQSSDKVGRECRIVLSAESEWLYDPNIRNCVCYIQPTANVELVFTMQYLQHFGWDMGNEWPARSHHQKWQSSKRPKWSRRFLFVHFLVVFCFYLFVYYFFFSFGLCCPHWFPTVRECLQHALSSSPKSPILSHVRHSPSGRNDIPIIGQLMGTNDKHFDYFSNRFIPF